MHSHHGSMTFMQIIYSC